MTRSTQLPPPLTEEAALREIEGFVREATRSPSPDANPVPEALPELEAVARDLGISIEALRALRETALG